MIYGHSTINNYYDYDDDVSYSCKITFGDAQDSSYGEDNEKPCPDQLLEEM